MRQDGEDRQTKRKSVSDVEEWRPVPFSAVGTNRATDGWRWSETMTEETHTTGRTDGKLSAERQIPNERDGIKKSVVAFFSVIFHLSRFPQMLIICAHIKLVVRAETTLPAGCGRRMKE